MTAEEEEEEKGKETEKKIRSQVEVNIANPSRHIRSSSSSTPRPRVSPSRTWTCCSKTSDSPARVARRESTSPPAPLIRVFPSLEKRANKQRGDETTRELHNRLCALAATFGFGRTWRRGMGIRRETKERGKRERGKREMGQAHL